jgi:hypothetical protein
MRVNRILQSCLLRPPAPVLCGVPLAVFESASPRAYNCVTDRGMSSVQRRPMCVLAFLSGSVPKPYMLPRNPARLVTVALANKLALIVFAMMKTGESFRTEKFARA